MRAEDENGLSESQVAHVVGEACAGGEFVGRRVLVIVPDNTRTAPVGMVFKALHRQLSSKVSAMDVMIALGTHPPMSEAAICQRLELSDAERNGPYARVKFLNHAWNNPEELQEIGCISGSTIRDLTDGLFEMDVPVELNRHVLTYDHLVIIGPVFPHEVVGFSGGNKYFFPGVGGPGILNFFHWLGAVVTNSRIIGRKLTPVRKVVDAAGAMIDRPKTCFCLVVGDHKEMAGLYAGTPESAWVDASEHSRQIHIVYKDKPFHTILSVAPPMYDELWTAGKAMYKLEPVVADGGELIIYAPHLKEISLTHGAIIRAVGYHVRDYFLKQWEKYRELPWGVLAHSTHVKGAGTYENGVESPRVKVTIASQIPESVCREIHLGYRDPASIRVEDYMNREAEGVLYVPKAGERLFLLNEG
jgi:lactate racemase